MASISLHRKSVARITDLPNMTLDIKQETNQSMLNLIEKNKQI